MKDRAVSKRQLHKLFNWSLFYRNETKEWWQDGGFTTTGRHRPSSNSKILSWILFKHYQAVSKTKELKSISQKSAQTESPIVNLIYQWKIEMETVWAITQVH